MAVVVGYLPSAEGAAAVDAAVAEAALRGMTLIVVNVGRAGPRIDPELAAEPVLDALRARLDRDGIRHEVRQLRAGMPPAEALLQVAGEVDAELIVLGLRRRTPIGKFITGSTAQQVLLEARCPVLAVKAGQSTRSSR